MREPVHVCDRRAFVMAVASTAAAPLLGACASLVARPVTPIDGRVELAFQHYPELTRPGGWLKLQPAGHPEPVYVLLLDSGDIAALSPVCTHLGCTVDIEGPLLVCPCHGSTYDRAGRVLRGPAALPLAQYPVERAADGNVTIDLRGRR